MLNALMVAIVVTSAIWVYLDATKHKIGKIIGKKSLFNMAAGAWAIVTMMLWVIGFPSYLIKRNALKKLAQTNPIETNNRTIKTTLIALAGSAFFVAALPANPPAITNIQFPTNTNTPTNLPARISNPKEYALDIAGERICIEWGCDFQEYGSPHNFYAHLDQRSIDIAGSTWFDGDGISHEQAEALAGKKIFRASITDLIHFQSDGRILCEQIIQERDTSTLELSTRYLTCGGEYKILPGKLEIKINRNYTGMRPQGSSIQLSRFFVNGDPEVIRLLEKKCANALILGSDELRSDQGQCLPTQEYETKIQQLLSTPSVLAAKTQFLSEKNSEEQARLQQQEDAQRQACLNGEDSSQIADSAAAAAAETDDSDREQSTHVMVDGVIIDCATNFPHEFSQRQNHTKKNNESRRIMCLEYGNTRGGTDCRSAFPEELSEFKRLTSNLQAQHPRCSDSDISQMIELLGGLSKVPEGIKISPPPCIQLEILLGR